MAVTRAEVVQALLRLYEAPRYLEIGVEAGVTFHSLVAAKMVAVDPSFVFDVGFARTAREEASYFEMTSDSFFGIPASESYDVIFLDGLHTFEQTLRDFTNALGFLSRRGVIVIDDVVPDSYFASIADLDEFRRLRAQGLIDSSAWMGDVYRLVFMIDSFFQQLSFATVQENHGQLVVWRRARRAVEPRKIEDIAHLPYEAVLRQEEVFNYRPLSQIVAEVAAWIG